MPPPAIPDLSKGHSDPPRDVTPRPPLTTGTRLAYGVSAFGENLGLNSVLQLAFPIFNLVLGVSPALVGLALALPRIWDAFTDPWMGSISDNFHSRWGRRRPFIVVGAILTALCVAGIWMFPEGRSPDFYFWWLLVGSMVLASAHTVFVVPYGALGLELTDDYHERTRLMSFRAGCSKVSGLLNQWLFKIVQLGIFTTMLAGARSMSILIAVIIATVGLITGIKMRERRDIAPRKRVNLSFWASWRETMRQPNFIRLSVAQVSIFASILLVDNLGFYLNVFYVNGGDTSFGGLLKGASGTAFQLGGLLFLPFMVRLSGRLGKQRTFRLCTLSIIAGGIAKWFCYAPGAGWWILVPSLLLAPGLVAVLALVPSMIADICDIDEAKTHARREGMFNATSSWLLKLSNSITVFLSGLLLTVAGWKTDLGAHQAPETFLTMRLLFCGSTVACAIIAAYALRRYGVDEAMVNAAHAQSAAERDTS